VNLRRFQLPREVFGELATGGGGPEAIASLVAAEYCKHVVLLNGVLRAVRGTERYASVREGCDLLAEAWRASPDATEAVVRYPAVGVWARRTIQAIRSGAQGTIAESSGLLAVSAAAAIRAGLDAQIKVPVRDGLVVLPSLGAAVIQGSGEQAVTVRSSRGGATVGPVDIPPNPHVEAPGWLPLSRVRAGAFDVLIDNLHPFRMPGLAQLSRRASAPSELEDALQDAWLVLESGHTNLAAEVGATVSVIVPQSPMSARATSSTSPEAFGAVAMSVPRDPISGAESLVHEVQHLKLAALLDVVRLILPDDGRRYYAPWRDDPRPLGGLLQGTYAFLGVTRFWREQRANGSTSGADRKYARSLQGVTLATGMLRASDRLTPAGQEFLGHVEQTLTSWRQDFVPATAWAEARRAALAHQARWEAANGPLRA
jgi:HEXXH motif-containing protein